MGQVYWHTPLHPQLPSFQHSWRACGCPFPRHPHLKGVGSRREAGVSAVDPRGASPIANGHDDRDHSREPGRMIGARSIKLLSPFIIANP